MVKVSEERERSLVGNCNCTYLNMVDIRLTSKTYIHLSANTKGNIAASNNDRPVEHNIT